MRGPRRPRGSRSGNCGAPKLASVADGRARRWAGRRGPAEETRPAGLHGSHSGHRHGPPGGETGPLTRALALLGAFLVVEVVVAILSSSLALLADAGHMLVDAAAIAAALVATRLARRPAEGAWTFGLRRAEILSAAFNGVTLVVIGLFVLVDAILRLLHPTRVDGLAVLVVAIVGVGVNLAAARVLAGSDRRALHVEGAFRHVLTDLYGFLATALAGIVIVTTGFARADALASLVIVLLMGRTAWQLLGSAGRILLEAAPEDVDLDAVRDHLLGAPHVEAVHDLHVWTVTSGLPALSAHVVVASGCFDDGHTPQILDSLQACVRGHFDVAHSTFQLEPGGHGPHEFETHP